MTPKDEFKAWHTVGYTPPFPAEIEKDTPRFFLDKYFREHECYPKEIMNNLLPWGKLYCYVSSTFLNGFINYVEIESAFVGNRYSPNNSKSEILELERGSFHTKLDVFGDDVVILARISEGRYAYFYFDMDVSDCCIGRFSTDTAKDKLVKEFEFYCENELEEIGFPTKLPKDFFTGWIKF